MWDSKLFLHMFSCYLWIYKDEILVLVKLVAKQNNFRRLWALVCSPPFKRQGEPCERSGVTTHILLMILPVSIYSCCPLRDLKFPVGVSALTRMQI